MNQNNQQGFSLIGAVFIIVILSLISSFIVSLAAMARSTTDLSIQGVRALMAAKSGIEWGVHQVVSNPTTCPATTTLNLTQGGVSGFSSQVTCSSTSYTEGINTFNVFTITAFAQRGSFGSTDYVSRRMEVTVTLGA